jgi:hypothetical protein
VGFANNLRRRRFEPGRTTPARRDAGVLAFRGAYRGGRSAGLRVGALALMAIAAAAWGLVRHYTHVPPPMLVPTSPAAAPTYDPEAGELPAPDLEGVDTVGAPAAPTGRR